MVEENGGGAGKWWIVLAAGVVITVWGYPGERAMLDRARDPVQALGIAMLGILSGVFIRRIDE